MMHLASQHKEIERPSVFDLACRILKDVIRLDPHMTYLWTHGRWHPASLDDVMRRANQRLKDMGRAQFTQKREWIIQ